MTLDENGQESQIWYLFKITIYYLIIFFIYSSTTFGLSFGANLFRGVPSLSMKNFVKFQTYNPIIGLYALFSLNSRFFTCSMLNSAQKELIIY